MFFRRFIPVVAVVLVGTAGLSAQRPGRKYKAPPETSKLEITVVRDSTGKILESAAVIFHPTKDGVDEGNLEIKTGSDGKAMIDIIPTGSKVAVQVISSGFATYSGDLMLTERDQKFTVRMKRPQEQVSAYETRTGESKRVVGVQEPAKAKVPAAATALPADAPVIKLPGMSAGPKSSGDSTVPRDHNVMTPDPSQPKMPNKSSAPLGTTVDGTAGSSPSNP